MGKTKTKVGQNVLLWASMTKGRRGRKVGQYTEPGDRNWEMATQKIDSEEEREKNRQSGHKEYARQFLDLGVFRGGYRACRIGTTLQLSVVLQVKKGRDNRTTERGGGEKEMNVPPNVFTRLPVQEARDLPGHDNYNRQGKSDQWDRKWPR